MAENIELTLDTEYAPSLSSTNLGDPKEEVKFLIVKYITESDDINISLIEDTPEHVAVIESMKEEGCIVEVIGSGTAKNTSIAELVYGINHPTRVLFRSGVNDIVKMFTEGDKLLKDSLQ